MVLREDRKPSLLWVSHFVPYPPKGGLMQRSYNLIAKMADNWTIDLLCFVQPGVWEGIYENVEEALEAARPVLENLCRSVAFIPMADHRGPVKRHLYRASSVLSRYPYDVRWLRSDAMRETIRGTYSRNQNDLVHLDTIGLAQYRDEITRAPVTLTHHNIESNMLERRAVNTHNFLMRTALLREARKLKIYERRYADSFALHVTCSSLDSQRLESICRKDINTIEVPNGVDTDYFQPTQDSTDANKLIFAGGLSWYPNRSAIEHFARSIWPLIKERNENAIMHVVGRNPSEEIRQVAKADCSFLVRGFVDDIRPDVTEAAVYVCPIFDGGGTKLKVLDAFAMGKAVVAYAPAVEGLDVVDGVHVLVADDATSFAELVLRAMNESELRRNIGNAAYQLAREYYGFDRIANQMSTSYSTLLKAS